jgi:type I restriction enzyme M protein
MQDDVYAIVMDGWKAGNEYNRLVIKGKKGKDGKTAKDKEIAGLAGIEGRLIAPQLLIDTYFVADKEAITEQEQKAETAQARLTEIEEEHSGDEGLFADLDKVNATEVAKLLKEKKKDKVVSSSGVESEIEVLEEYIANAEAIKKANAEIKKLNEVLEKKVLAKYPVLTEAEIKNLVLVKKWEAYLQNALQQEQERISQNLTQRIKQLAERYATTLPELTNKLSEAETKVQQHLAKMGFAIEIN